MIINLFICLMIILYKNILFIINLVIFEEIIYEKKIYICIYIGKNIYIIDNN